MLELSFRDFEFHGYMGRRRVVSFGWRYEFSARHLRKADRIPGFLLALRPAAAAFAGMEPKELQHVLVTEYGPGASRRRWRRKKAVSVGACRYAGLRRRDRDKRKGVPAHWRRVRPFNFHRAAPGDGARKCRWDAVLLCRKALKERKV